MDRTFAELVDDAATRLGFNDYKLSHAIGLLPSTGTGPGKAVDPKQIGRLRRGEQRHYSQPLVQRLIEILGLDEDEAWHAAGVWPPALDLESYRAMRQRPLVPALTRAGGSDTPTAFSSRNTGPTTDQQGSSIPGSTTPAGQLIHLDDWRPVRPHLEAA